jgi:hypothetical protein
MRRARLPDLADLAVNAGDQIGVIVAWSQRKLPQASRHLPRLRLGDRARPCLRHRIIAVPWSFRSG